MKGKYKEILIFTSMLFILIISIGMTSASENMNLEDSMSDSSETILEDEYMDNTIMSVEENLDEDKDNTIMSVEENLDEDMDHNIISVEKDLDEDHAEGIIGESPKKNKDKVIAASADSEPAVQANNDNEDILEDYYSGSLHIEINNCVDIDGGDEIFYIEDTNGLSGTITLSIDGKKVFSRKYKKSDKLDYLTINSDDIKLGKFGYGYHIVNLTYGNVIKKSVSRNVSFITIPDIEYPSSVSIGENQGIAIRGKGKLNGTATLYNRVETGKDKNNNPIYKRGNLISTAKITEGYGWIPLSIPSNGTYNFELAYKYGNYQDIETISINAIPNSPEFISSVSPQTIIVGKAITIRLTGPEGTGDVDIYDNNKLLKSIRFNFGSIEETLSGLKIGTHHINIRYSDSDNGLFYSQTYIVNVKDHKIKINLKKVTVKKSAKKLVIKAGLKIDGKVAKKKKLIFKFNKTKYTAKTNKKGIAKITVPKYILKKLKVGKTVKIQVTYGNKTVKQSVKVKK